MPGNTNGHCNQFQTNLRMRNGPKQPLRKDIGIDYCKLQRVPGPDPPACCMRKMSGMLLAQGNTSLPSNPADINDASYLGGGHTPKAVLGEAGMMQVRSWPGWDPEVESQWPAFKLGYMSEALGRHTKVRARAPVTCPLSNCLPLQSTASPWPTAVDALLPRPPPHSGAAHQGTRNEVKRARKAGTSAMGAAHQQHASNMYHNLSTTGVHSTASVENGMDSSTANPPAHTSHSTSTVATGHHVQGRQATTTAGRATVTSWPSREDMDVDTPVSPALVDSFLLPKPLPCRINGWQGKCAHAQAHVGRLPAHVFPHSQL